MLFNSSVVDLKYLNFGYLELGILALVFGGLQVWWITSTIRRRNQSRPLSGGGVPKNPGANLRDRAGDGLAVKLPSNGRHPLVLIQ